MPWSLAPLLLLPFLISFITYVLLVFTRRSFNARIPAQRQRLAKALKCEPTKRVVGFFHPYCDAGGGGERVLWTAIALIQKTKPDVISVVYTGDTDVTKEGIIAKVKSRFDIDLSPDSLHFVFLKNRHWVEDHAWPRFTLIGQSLGSIYLAWEAISLLVPDLFLDTMGYAFTFPLVSFLTGKPIGAYVHYPTISVDMLARVRERKTWHTNAGNISSSLLLSKLKLIYYRIFMYYYAWSLRTANFLMANSTWTKNHVDSILQHRDPFLDIPHLFLTPFLWVNHIFTANHSVDIVYPPCDVRPLTAFPLQNRERIILSVAQFRPEKDHKAQLEAFAALLERHPEFSRDGPQRVRLVLVGGSRNEGDARRVEDLRALAKTLKIDHHVQFVINAPFSEVLRWLSKASIGLSTMVDEHFGINVVEFMAAGVIPVAHASGGPLKDIVVPYHGLPTGYHATKPGEFAGVIADVLRLSPRGDEAMRSRARALALEKFSNAEFARGWDASGWRKWLM